MSVGVYNKDLELLATVVVDQDDVLPPAQRIDPFYTVQAIYQMPNHEGEDEPIIDPMSSLQIESVMVDNEGLGEDAFTIIKEGVFGFYEYEIGDTVEIVTAGSGAV